MVRKAGEFADSTSASPPAAVGMGSGKGKGAALVAFGEAAAFEGEVDDCGEDCEEGESRKQKGVSDECPFRLLTPFSDSEYVWTIWFVNGVIRTQPLCKRL